MPDLRIEEAAGKGDQLPPGRHRWLRGAAGVPGRARVRARALAAGIAPAEFWRNHRLMTILVGLSILPRVLAALAFRPALLIPDSFGYLHEGLRLTISAWHPAGYPLLLLVLRPFHSLLLVITLQHLTGIGAGIIGYGLLRYWGLPAWGAALAAVPTLFDSRQITLESYILPDAVFGFVVLVAVAVLLSKRRPVPWQCATAGLLLAWAAILRGNGAPIMVAAAAFMLVRRVGWRALAAGLAAFAIPLAGYAAVFDAAYGQFNITDSTGMFLWSRTTSFADCAVTKPPPVLRPLCPGAQPGHPATAAPAWSVPALLAERSPGQYLWAGGAWWRHDAHPGLNAYNNQLAMRFAIDAIKAQPLGYLRVTAQGVLLTFLATDRSESYFSLHFTPGPDVRVLSRSDRRNLSRYGHTTANTHAAEPYAYFMYLYQLPVFFPGVVFFLVVAAGLAGLVRQWRRWGGPAALPWAVAAIAIVAPVALHEYLYRYVIVAIPVACVAAGLAFTRLPASDPAGRAASATAAPGSQPRDDAPRPGPAAAGVPKPPEG